MATDSTPDVLLTATPKLQRTARSVAGDILRRWWVAFAISSVCVVSGHLMIKAGLNHLIPPPAGTGFLTKLAHQFLQPQVFAGLLVYVTGTVCWMRAVSQKEISFLYPMTSLNYVLVTGATVVLFHEVMSVQRTVGVIVIVIGMLLMNRQSDRRNA